MGKLDRTSLHLDHNMQAMGCMEQSYKEYIDVLKTSFKDKNLRLPEFSYQTPNFDESRNSLAFSIVEIDRKHRLLNSVETEKRGFQDAYCSPIHKTSKSLGYEMPSEKLITRILDEELEKLKSRSREAHQASLRRIDRKEKTSMGLLIAAFFAF